MNRTSLIWSLVTAVGFIVSMNYFCDYGWFSLVSWNDILQMSIAVIVFVVMGQLFGSKLWKK